MSKKVLGDRPFFEEEGDIIDRVTREHEYLEEQKRKKKIHHGVTESTEKEEEKKSLKLLLNEMEGPLTDNDITLNTVTDYYQKRLYDNDNAVEYLKSKGIIDPRLFDRFQVGFNDGSIKERLSKKQMTNLHQIFSLREDFTKLYEGCLVFPLFDENEQVINICFLNISDNSEQYLYPDRPGIFNHKASRSYSDQLILTETVLDALSLLQLGFNNVQSFMMNKSSFTDSHIQHLKDNNVRNAVIAFKSNEFSVDACGILKELLLLNHMSIKIIYPPEPHNSWSDAVNSGLSKDELIQEINDSQTFSPEEKEEIKGKKTDYGYDFQSGKVVYQLSGLKEVFVNNMKVNIKVYYGDNWFPDSIDLYASRSRTGLINNLSNRFGLEPKRIEKDLLLMIEYLEKERDRALSGEEAVKELTAEEKETGLAFLRNENMIAEIINDVTALGYVGEDLNKLLLYLCAASRLTSYPISVLIIAQSATGKSFLVDTVKKLVPSHEVITIHSVSQQGLNYTKDLVNKFLAFGEAIFTPEVERQIREMLSSKELSRMVVNKDDTTGELISKLVSKDVLVACVMSTTSNNVHPENASRFFIINADESFSQTQRIHAKQMEKYSTDRYYEKKESVPDMIKKHHAAQRLLQKVQIVIPKVMREMIKFPYHSLRTRRDHERFIDLMATVTFLRQYQKEQKEFKDGKVYVECDEVDYDIAKMVLIQGTLSSTLSEIPESAVRLYDAVREMVKEIAETEGLRAAEVSFTQRNVREFTGFGQSWIKQNLRVLTEYEYISRIRGGNERGSRAFYQLKADEDIKSIDFSCLPTAEELKKALEKEKEN